MRYQYSIFAAVVILMLTGFQATGIAEEDLFDTKAAADHFEKAMVHLKAKNYTAAAHELEESVSIYPDAEPFYYLGYAYYLKGKTGDSESRKRAIENFEKAYELNPNFTPTRMRTAAEEMTPGEMNSEERIPALPIEQNATSPSVEVSVSQPQ